MKMFFKSQLLKNHALRKYVLCRPLHTYLESRGWFNSLQTMIPQDALGRAIPWYTYPSIDFINEHLKPEFEVFEFGSGNSTLYWAERCSHVTSCEHDLKWYEMLKSRLPENVSYLFHELESGGDYSKAAKNCGRRFDIINIDGRDRVNCAIESLSALKDGGIFIWDNSDRERYEPGYRFLAEQGFRRVNFWGFGASTVHQWSTSVFYRDNNCFGI